MDCSPCKGKPFQKCRSISSKISGKKFPPKSDRKATNFTNVTKSCFCFRFFCSAQGCHLQLRRRSFHRSFVFAQSHSATRINRRILPVCVLATVGARAAETRTPPQLLATNVVGIAHKPGDVDTALSGVAGARARAASLMTLSAPINLATSSTWVVGGE